MNQNEAGAPSNVAPILGHKGYADPAVFTPANLLREARRQKALAYEQVLRICVLDPDDDIVEHLRETGCAEPDPYWACYHTRLYNWTQENLTFGIIGWEVGALFAVLVTEELFASGCRTLISVTSAGQITPVAHLPYFDLIERALRDEGTSYHYVAPSQYSERHPELLEMLGRTLLEGPTPIVCGTAWTTDASFRKTATEIERHRSAGILVAETEASALYAFAQATKNPIVCFAHVTNQMASIEGDFEKGMAQGSVDARRVVSATAERWLAWNEQDVALTDLPESSAGEVSGGSKR
jgi:uridine phosphorylase